MRRITDLYPGEAKTDAKDAFIIADAARAMPYTLRAIDGEDETIAEPEMIVGFDDDLVRHEAPCDRVEVEGLHHRTVAAVRVKLRAA